MLIAITIGTIAFVLVPGIGIQLLEQWKYIDAIYYVFITLFTIGFGDFVAGKRFQDEFFLDIQLETHQLFKRFRCGHQPGSSHVLSIFALYVDVCGDGVHLIDCKSVSRVLQE